MATLPNAAVTFPLDMIKTRLQAQGESGFTRLACLLSSVHARSVPVVQVVKRIEACSPLGPVSYERKAFIVCIVVLCLHACATAYTLAFASARTSSSVKTCSKRCRLTGECHNRL